jgi:beta-1,4-mannosyltransferase
VALMALSLGRPVLLPRSDTALALGAEVGPAWVLTYEPPLAAADLVEGLRRASIAADSGGPDLSGREWPEGIAAHRRAYLAALAGRRGLRARRGAAVRPTERPARRPETLEATR